MTHIDGIDPDCGCPTRKCLMFPYEVDIHLEPNGTGDAFMDCGDYDILETFPAITMKELQIKTQEYINKLHTEDKNKTL